MGFVQDFFSFSSKKHLSMYEWCDIQGYCGGMRYSPGLVLCHSSPFPWQRDWEQMECRDCGAQLG